MHPARRNGFQNAHEIGESQRMRKGNEKMNMIGHAVDGQRRSTRFPNDPAHVSKHAGPQLIGEKSRTILGAENDVCQELREGMRHASYAPPGLCIA